MTTLCDIRPPIWRLPKEMLAGERLTNVVSPFADRETNCGLPAALSLTASTALRGPTFTGRHWRPSVRDAPGARVACPVSLPIRKSCGFVPAKLMLWIVSELSPLLVIVSVRAALGDRKSV